MPGDPKECRKHGATCRRLAETANGPTARQTFLNLADTWERLASELESAKLFLEAMDSIESAPDSLTRFAGRNPDGLLPGLKVTLD
jgi:hypothetical protein